MGVSGAKPDSLTTNPRPRFGAESTIRLADRTPQPRDAAPMGNERMSMMVGDGSYPDDLVNFPIPDEVSTFSGHAGINVDRARVLVR